MAMWRARYPRLKFSIESLILLEMRAGDQVKGIYKGAFKKLVQEIPSLHNEFVYFEPT